MSYVRAVNFRIGPRVCMNMLVNNLHAIGCFIRYKYGIKEPDISVENTETCNFISRFKNLSLTSLNLTNYDVINCIPEFVLCL